MASLAVSTVVTWVNARFLLGPCIAALEAVGGRNGSTGWDPDEPRQRGPQAYADARNNKTRSTTT